MPAAISLAASRKGKGVSQVQLAAAIGFDQPHISKLEKEGADMMLSTLRKFAARLEVRLTLEGEEKASWKIDL